MANFKIIEKNSLRNKYYKTKKTLTIASTALLAFVIIAATVPSTVLAASPHFIGTPTLIKNPNFSIQVSFKAAGLANIVSAAFLSSSGGTANLQCQNPGGNNPPPKTVTFGPIISQPVQIPPSNGQITATTNPLGPPPVPSASQICPNPNWSVQIVSITYFNVVLHIQQSNVDILTFNFDTVTVP